MYGYNYEQQIVILLLDKRGFFLWKYLQNLSYLRNLGVLNVDDKCI